MSVVVALALMHFIWQGALIGAVAWVAMRLSHTPTTRYAIGVVALMAMAIAPVVGGMNQVQGPRFEVPSPTSSQVLGTSLVPGPASSSSVQPNVIVASPADVVAETTGDATRGKWNVDPAVLSTVFSLWLFGVALLSTRLTLGWWAARRLTRRSVRQPSLQVLSNAERLMGALGITGGVRVLESALVQVPTAMGWLKPVVLLPASAMTGLSIAQIDALVAHELAHIKRHDYLVNLLQSAIETLLFYHPAVWLISRRVREERELCCDDLAIAACNNDRVTYVSALAELESLRQVAAPALAANGGSLLARIRRILAPDDVQTVRGRGHWIAGVAILSITIALLGAQVAATKSAEKASPTASDVRQSTPPEVRSAATPEVRSESAAGVRNEEPGVVAPDELQDNRVIAVGQLLHLEVTTPVAGTQGDRSELTKAEADSARKAAQYQRLAKVDLGSSEAVWAAATTVPGFATDPQAMSHVQQITALRNDRSRRKSTEGLGDAHPRIVAIDSDIAHQLDALKQRLVAIVLTNEQASTEAKEVEDRIRVSFNAQSRNLSPAASARDSELSDRYTVQADGSVLLPFAGRVKAAGSTVSAFSRAVRSALNDKGIRTASVLVSIEGRSSDASVFVLGEVKTPGAYPWRAGLTVAQAISMAGGVTLTGSIARAEMRPGAKVASADESVPAGTTLTVPAKRRIAITVAGAVRSPGTQTLLEDKATLADALTAAGGMLPASGDVIRLRRAGSSGAILHTRRDLEEGRLANVTLQDADVVEVPAASRVFINGFVSTAGEFQWEENLTIERALLKAGGAKPEAAIEHLTLRRLDPVTKSYETVPIEKDGLRTVVRPDDVITLPKKEPATVQMRGAVRSPGQLLLAEDKMTLHDAIAAAGGLQPSAGLEIRARSANSSAWTTYKRSALDAGELRSVKLSPGAVIEVPVGQRFFVTGFVKTPGEFQWEPNLTIERALLMAGGVLEQGAGNRFELKRLNPVTKKYETVQLGKDRFQTLIQPDDLISVPKKRM